MSQYQKRFGLLLKSPQHQQLFGHKQTILNQNDEKQTKQTEKEEEKLDFKAIKAHPHSLHYTRDEDEPFFDENGNNNNYYFLFLF